MLNTLSKWRRWTPSGLVLAAGLLMGAGAQAGGVQWSVGVNLPMHGVVAYAGQPGVIVAQAPMYAAAPVIYAPQRVEYLPPQYVGGQRYMHQRYAEQRHWREEARRHRHHHEHEHRRHGWQHGGY